MWPILGAPYADVLERQRVDADILGGGICDPLLRTDAAHRSRHLWPILSHVPEAAELVELDSTRLPPSATTNAGGGRSDAARSRKLKRPPVEPLHHRNDSNSARIWMSASALFNGEPGDPRSFDSARRTAGAAAYVLSFWQVAREKVNYRRFFDIADLVGVNVEEPEVFAATHSLIFQLVDEGWVTGLRVDHIDGLYDPSEYLRRLRERLPDCFIVVEKILEQQESLCPDWPVSGTTGYDFINALGSIMVNPEGLERITAAYRQITGTAGAFADVVYETKTRDRAALRRRGALPQPAPESAGGIGPLRQGRQPAGIEHRADRSDSLPAGVPHLHPVVPDSPARSAINRRGLSRCQAAQSPLERNHLELRPARVAARLSAEPRSRSSVLAGNNSSSAGSSFAAR